ncbi:uncharacterized protein [Misgurnus anguillicaudatus]|uniref:uncharacterized protein isoform X1 n=2 Tax=Misgurnus anguillicaudatus TaxID=75329 RepID=UPI003CCF803E
MGLLSSIIPKQKGAVMYIRWLPAAVNTQHCHGHAKPTDGDIFLNPEKPLQSPLAMNKEKVRELTSQTPVVQADGHCFSGQQLEVFCTEVIGTAVSQHHLLACTSRMRPIQMRFSPMPANRQWKTRASTSPPTLPQAFEITTYNCSPFMRPDAMLGSPGPPSPGMYTLHQVNNIRVRQSEILKKDSICLVETVRRTSLMTSIFVSGPLSRY